MHRIQAEGEDDAHCIARRPLREIDGDNGPIKSKNILLGFKVTSIPRAPESQFPVTFSDG